MHGVDLGKVAPEGASGPHLNPPHRIQTSSYLGQQGEVNQSSISYNEIEWKVPQLRFLVLEYYGSKKKKEKAQEQPLCHAKFDDTNKCRCQKEFEYR